MRQKPSLADVIDFEIQIRRDRELDRQSLRKRDRYIGQNLELDPENRTGSLLEWLDEMRKQDTSLPGKQLEAGLQIVKWILSGFGVIAGYGTAYGLLSTGGTHPINIVYYLGILVGLQLLLFALWGISTLPASVLHYLPFASSFQEVLHLLQPGRLATLITRFLPEQSRSSIQQAFGELKSTGEVYGPLQKWLFISLSQYVALFFNIGALLSTLLLVVFSDLTFSWNTTLQIDPETFHSIVYGLAIPWADWLPEAAPTMELVQSTRYDRLTESFRQGPLSPAHSGAWWRFLVVSLVTYGLVPRFLALLFSEWRLKSNLGDIHFSHTEGQRLYDRITSPRFEMTSETPDQDPPDFQQTESRVSGKINLKNQSIATVVWGNPESEGETIKRWISSKIQASDYKLLRAGELDPETDSTSLQKIREIDPDGVIVLVAAWEEPTRDIRNYLKKIRKEIGKEKPIVVIPAGGKGNLLARDPASERVDIWKRILTRIGDPWLRVEPPELAPDNSSSQN